MSADENGYVPGVNHQAMEIVWQHSDAKGNDRIVLLAITRFVNAAGKAWPGFDTLERLTGYSESTITRCLNRLEDAGELRVIDRRARNEPNLYTVLLLKQPSVKMSDGLGSEPSLKMSVKLPCIGIENQESKKKKTTHIQGSSSRNMSDGPEVTADDETLRLSFMIADAMIESGRKGHRYRIDAESFDWIDGTEKLMLAMTPGEREEAERYLGDVLDHVVSSDRWQHIKMPPELHSLWKPIRESMPDEGIPPEQRAKASA
ncbi:MAG: helix-turn-helix domain-containing protein [Solirubrobacterales bacterium]